MEVGCRRGRRRGRLDMHLTTTPEYTVVIAFGGICMKKGKEKTLVCLICHLYLLSIDGSNMSDTMYSFTWLYHGTNSNMPAQQPPIGILRCTHHVRARAKAGRNIAYVGWGDFQWKSR